MFKTCYFFAMKYQKEFRFIFLKNIDNLFAEVEGCTRFGQAEELL
jgi:hypothetical protein